VTGFVVDDAAQATDAVRSVATLDRATCRAMAERRFGVERMVQDYVAVYDQILRGGGG